MYTLKVQSQEESTALAARLGQLLEAGDVLILNGALAAGKTYFVKALTEALGSQRRSSRIKANIAGGRLFGQKVV